MSRANPPIHLTRELWVCRISPNLSFYVSVAFHTDCLCSVPNSCSEPSTLLMTLRMRKAHVLDHHLRSRAPTADTTSRRQGPDHLGLEPEGMGHHPGHHPQGILPRATAHSPAIPLNINNSPRTPVRVDKPQDMDRHSNSRMDMAGHHRTLQEAHQGIRRLARILRHRVVISDVRGVLGGPLSEILLCTFSPSLTLTFTLFCNFCPC